MLIAAKSGQENGPAAGEPQWLKDERGYTSHDQPGELYNLREDRIQKNNLYAEKPELVRELTELLEKLIRDGRSTPGPTQQNDVNVRIEPPPPFRPKPRAKN